MITKTDLAKFENVWDEHPRWVNLGAQKNFAKYAPRIGKEWSTVPDGFNELYFRRIIARALIFRATEKLVSDQPWYNGGYRANIVAYSIAAISEICMRKERLPDFLTIWNTQTVTPGLLKALTVSARFVKDDIIRPPQGISNISEWAKRDACWIKISGRLSSLEEQLNPLFWSELLPLNEHKLEEKLAKKTQKIDDGVNAQKRVFEVRAAEWKRILIEGAKRKLLTPKEIGILEIAEKMPRQIPTEKQSNVLLEILAKAELEGITSMT